MWVPGPGVCQGEDRGGRWGCIPFLTHCTTSVSYLTTLSLSFPIWKIGIPVPVLRIETARGAISIYPLSLRGLQFLGSLGRQISVLGKEHDTMQLVSQLKRNLLLNVVYVFMPGCWDGVFGESSANGEPGIHTCKTTRSKTH